MNEQHLPTVLDIYRFNLAEVSDIIIASAINGNTLPITAVENISLDRIKILPEAYLIENYTGSENKVELCFKSYDDLTNISGFGFLIIQMDGQVKIMGVPGHQEPEINTSKTTGKSFAEANVIEYVISWRNQTVTLIS